MRLINKYLIFISLSLVGLVVFGYYNYDTTYNVNVQDVENILNEVECEPSLNNQNHYKTWKYGGEIGRSTVLLISIIYNTYINYNNFKNIYINVSLYILYCCLQIDF